MLDLKAIKVFLAVAELRSMTAAARRLGLSQSAVSQAIRQLEEYIGAVLVDRMHRPLLLTAAGFALRQRGAALVGEAESLYKAVREQAGGTAQMLRLGMVDSFAATVGPALIKELLSSAVHLHVSSGLAPGLGEALRERRLDMIVTTDAAENGATVERHRLLHERYVLLVARPLARAHPGVTIAELAKLAPLVRFNSDSHIGATIEHYLGELGMAPPHRLEIDTADSLVAMVAAGVGWALITPLCLMQARADPAQVVPLPLPGVGCSRELTLVSRHGEYGDLPRTIAQRVAAIFASEGRSQLQRLAPWLGNTVTVL
jgi:DNA-binding transcriptional LysR family regulator